MHIAVDLFKYLSILMALMTAKSKFILCFGNPFIDDDAAAQKLALSGETGIKTIAGHTLISCNSPEEIMFYLDKDFVILDVAKGIKKPMLINDLSMLETGKIVSLHDFDLAFFLNMMMKIGTKKKMKIIAVPMKSSLTKL